MPLNTLENKSFLATTYSELPFHVDVVIGTYKSSVGP